MLTRMLFFICLIFLSVTYANSVIEDQVAKIMTHQQPNQKIYLLEIPTPNNFLSEKIMITSLSMGTSSASVDTLLSMLSPTKNFYIGIIGKSEDTNIATVKSVLIHGKSAALSGTLYLVVNKDKDIQNLCNEAKIVGITLVPIIYE